jgi:UDP-GlcNAc:undecaprenyl-phosphate GlcNAc-1-phosphate transferase
MTIPNTLAVVLVALIVTNGLTPLVRRVARRLGAIDYPGGRRINTRPTPRLGGLAIYLGFLTAALLFMVVTRVELHRADGELYIRMPIRLQTDRALLGIMLGGTFLLAVGIYDDIRGMRPAVKFAAMVAAAAMLIPFGLATEFATNPLTGKTVATVGNWGAALTIAWVVVVVNVINIIDGVDGLAAGISAIAGTTLLLTAASKGDAVAVSLAAALIGATLGFLRHNFNPARIFMGDSGSMFLGYVLGGLSVMGLYKSYTALSLAVPILPLGVPIADTVFAVVRRFRSGRPIYLPDRGHVHHRLLARGLTQRQTVFILYLVSALLGLGALAISGVNRAGSMVTLGIILAMLLVGAQRMGLLTR